MWVIALNNQKRSLVSNMTFTNWHWWSKNCLLGFSLYIFPMFVQKLVFSHTNAFYLPFPQFSDLSSRSGTKRSQIAGTIGIWNARITIWRTRAPLGRSKYGKNRPHSAKIFTNFVIAPERLGAGIFIFAPVILSRRGRHFEPLYSS